MANIKFSQFTNQAAADTTYLVGFDGTDNTNYTKAQIKTWLTSGSNAIPTLYSENGTLADNRTITMNGNTLSMSSPGGNTVTFGGANNSGMAITGGNNYIVSFNGTYAISSIATSTSDAIVLRTSANASADTSILIDSRSPGASADLHLKTATKLKIDLPVAATVGYVLKADDVDGNVSWGAETDTNTNIANFNLVADAARTLTMGAYNLTIASTTAGQEVKFGQNVRVDGQGYTLQNDQSGITIDWDTGNVQYITLASGSQTFAPSNAESGATYILQLRQPGSGAAGTINWNNLVNWPGGTDPTLTATNGAFDIITLMYNGTLSKYFGTVVLDLK